MEMNVPHMTTEAPPLGRATLSDALEAMMEFKMAYASPLKHRKKIRNKLQWSVLVPFESQDDTASNSPDIIEELL